MTSGNFTSFPTAEIVVNRDQRQRRKLENIDELAASIGKIGLINPLVIDKDGTLIAGERRLTAIIQLGWTAVPIQFIEDLDEAEVQLIELEENVRRDELPWQDRVNALERYHQLRSQTEEDWSAAKTAEELNMSTNDVSYQRAIHKEMERGDERVINAPKLSVARGIVQRKIERRKASLTRGVEEVINPELAEERAEHPIPLEHTDFRKWCMKKQTKFNFIHCDFPYGVGAHKSDQGAASAMGGYDDDPDVYWDLLTSFLDNQDKFVADSAHLMFWFSMDYYAPTLDTLANGGWSVNPFPLVWVKSDNAGILPDPKRGPRRIYETALMASRGDRKVVQAVSNAFSSPTTKIIHMSEKPKPVLRQFFRMFVDEYTIMLDPTCGSANAVRVAQDLGATTVLGLEKDKEFFDLASENYNGDE